MPESFSIKKNFSKYFVTLCLELLCLARHSSIVNPIKVWVAVARIRPFTFHLSPLTFNLGGYSAEVPPLPIPNRVVKLSIADGTALHRGRVGSRHFQRV